MSKNIFANLFGGQILLLRGGIVRYWKLLLYIFVLIILYISIHYGVRDTMRTMARNQDELRNLKAEYTGKQSRLLHLSQRGEIEKMLQEKNSTLKAPKVPPVRILLSEDVGK